MCRPFRAIRLDELTDRKRKKRNKNRKEQTASETHTKPSIIQIIVAMLPHTNESSTRVFAVCSMCLGGEVSRDVVSVLYK